ncbi:hypothetical protein FXN61_22740 [Lentzea sp. PSKA42]|uniref:Uncharacterized protein n=2 Tax=Lentzea indica TaxID=2604800 RepID=A0ABX1FKJ8_9PSEU|nr:hypothetical protein [Lentzea indica]
MPAGLGGGPAGGGGAGGTAATSSVVRPVSWRPVVPVVVLLRVVAVRRTVPVAATVVPARA